MMKEECKINCCRCPKRDTCEIMHERLVNELFTVYGQPQKRMSEKVIRIYEQHPERLHTEKDILNSFEHTKQNLELLEEVILELKAYEIELTNRYNFIKTAPTRQKIKLYREKRYQEKVFYYIQFYDVNLTDGHEELTHSIKYTGKERKQAIEHFEQLKKEKSNAIFEMDIDKKSWER